MAQLWPADSVERWPLSKLIPYARNARTHTPEQIKQIAASMREWGWTIPVLADEGDSIIAGHARVSAAEINGCTEAPVMIARGWSEAKKRAYVLRITSWHSMPAGTKSCWVVELLELRDLGFDMPVIGFDQTELDSLMREVAEAGYPVLPEGEKAPYQEVTFTLHDEQVKIVQAAVTAAKQRGEFTDGLNDNANGNALTRICPTYLELAEDESDAGGSSGSLEKV
jgi:hypothetical protein